MKAVRLTRNLIVAIALVVSVGANVTLFVGGVLYSFVDKFVEEAFDLATAAGKQRKALAASKTQNANLKADNHKLRGELKNIRHSTASAAKRSRDRLAKSVGRSILTAPGKAVPYAGVAVVAGLTVWEIKDLCASIVDMNEIQKAAGVSEDEVGSGPADCSRPDLAVERAFEGIENSSRRAWDESKKYVPELPTWDEIRHRWPEEELRGWWPDGLLGTWERLKALWR